MQIYYMHKDKISVANSTLALLINLTSMQIVTITVAIISLLFNYKFMNQVLVILFIVGILLNGTALSILLISIFSKRLSRWLIKLAIRLLRIFRIKNIREKKYKLVVELKSYQSSAKYIKAHKFLMIKILLTTLVQFLVYYSIAFWTYKSLGFSRTQYT